MVRASDFGPRGPLVRTPVDAHFVVALSKSHLPCLVLVEPRKRWTDDREITLCLMLSPRDLFFRPDNMDETVPHTSFCMHKGWRKQQRSKMEIASFLVLTSFLIVFAKCATKSKIEKRIDALDNLFKSKMYLVDENLETGKQERELLMVKLNETLEYLAALVKGESNTLTDSSTSIERKQNDLDMILNKVEELSDKVKLNDRETGELSESFARIKRGVQQEKVARKSDASDVIKQLSEMKESQNEMANNMMSVVNVMHAKQVKMDDYLTNILGNQADIQNYIQNASKVQLEILKAQGELLSRVSESADETEDLKHSTTQLQHKIDLLTGEVSGLDIKVQDLNIINTVQEQLTQMHERQNLLIPSVQLVNGSNAREGRVEVTYGGRQVTVCDDDWDNDNAKVVCKMLGYSGGKALIGRGAHSFGEGTGEILLDNVECTGNEQSLFDCKHRGIGVEDCSHVEDAEVKCGP